MMVIVKNGKGHDVFVNGFWVMWLHGSKKNALKEYQRDVEKARLNESNDKII